MNTRIAGLIIIIVLLVLGSGGPITAQSGDDDILFVSNRNGDRDVYRMSPDGSEVIQLTSDAAQDRYPVWSPDRSKIAFVSNRNGRYAIYVMNADGRGVQQIIGGDGSYYEYPAWSPDGRHLVYSSDAAGSYDLYRVALDGSEPQRLTSSDEDEMDPSWSPDGSQIAFLQSIDGAYQLFVVDAAGGNPRSLLPGGGSDFVAPRWSPDGETLAFGVMTYDNLGNVAEVYVYNFNTDEERLLTSVEQSFITGISWSADGDALIYAQRSVTGGNALYQICIDGDCARALTSSDVDSIDPSWSTPPLRAGFVAGSILGVAPEGCSGLMESRLVIGELGRVLPGQAVNVRRTPSTSAERLDRMPGGRLFEVRGGPFCADGYAWWEVYHNQRVGYAAESGDGDYWLEPIGFLTQPRYNPAGERSVDTVQYAYQPFENGFMFWIRSTSQIFVLTNGSGWRVYPDFFVEGEQETDPAFQAPRNRVQPRRGFGKVWRNNPTVRDQVGWGMVREVGYNNRFEYDPSTGQIVLYDPSGRSFTLNTDGSWRR